MHSLRSCRVYHYPVSRNAELPTTKNPEMLSSKKASLIHDEGSITPKNQNPVGPVSSGADEGGLNRAPALGIEEADAELSKAAEAREEYASVAGEFAGNNGENQSQGLGSPGYDNEMRWIARQNHTNT